MLLRFPVLPELEFVLEGEELCTPAVLPEEGEEGRESCLLLILFLNIGNRETRVHRLDPESPIWDPEGCTAVANLAALELPAGRDVASTPARPLSSALLPPLLPAPPRLLRQSFAVSHC